MNNRKETPFRIRLPYTRLPWKEVIRASSQRCEQQFQSKTAQHKPHQTKPKHPTKPTHTRLRDPFYKPSQASELRTRVLFNTSPKPVEEVCTRRLREQCRLWNYPRPPTIPPEVAKDTAHRLNTIRLQQLKKMIAHKRNFLTVHTEACHGCKIKPISLNVSCWSSQTVSLMAPSYPLSWQRNNLYVKNMGEQESFKDKKHQLQTLAFCACQRASFNPI